MTPGSLKRVASCDRDISPPAKRKVTTTTTNKAVANFFRPTSERVQEPEKVNFQVINESLLIARHGSSAEAISSLPRPVKIAAFDFDDTVIATASGNRFAKNEHDWRWWHASVPAKLKQLHQEGYAVIVVSNQAAVSLRHDPKTLKGDIRSLNNLKGKITAVLTALDLPVTVFAATTHDLFRKPRTGMWERMLQDYGLLGHEHDVLDHEGSVFVGDAAGREGDKALKVKKDHSCSDRDFATNAGIRFQTPEEFFLDEEVKPFTRAFEPSEYLDVVLSADPGSSPVPTFTKRNDLDLVLFCGSPGAGKSTYYWQHMQPLGYGRVNQDILKTRDKCMKAATQHIEDKQSVVVDNTNADIETRAAWMKLGTKLQVPIRLVHFTAPAKLCEHNDTVRALTGELMNPESRVLLPKMAFTGFASRYREPTVAEGFQDITKVDFKFEGTEAQKSQWRRYWIS